MGECTDAELDGLLAYWEAANYLTVAQIYLQRNPLLRESLRPEHVEVNAFQRLSEVIVQKSIREGFGLVVSESLWKGTPVVAGRAGGIPMQMPEGVGGLLVDSVEECAAGMLRLLRGRELADQLGQSGRAHVREHFLLPRLLMEELRLLSTLGPAAPSRQRPLPTAQG